MGMKIIKGGDVFKKIEKLLKEKQSEVQAGFFKGFNRISGNKSIPQAQIAYWNEYGTDNGNIPPRPFMRNAVSKNESKWVSVLEKELIKNKLDIKKSINTLGEVMEGDIKKSITELVEPKNAESTIKRKKSSKPLIDTDLMRQSVKYKTGTLKV